MVFKKGIARSTLVTLILSTIVIAILIGFYNAFAESATDFGDVEICRGSVLARDQYFIDMGVFGDDILPPLLCETGHFLDLEADDRLDALEQISDLAEICWYKYADGQVVDVFGQGREREGKACGVCSRFEFEEGSFDGDVRDYESDYLDIVTSDFETISANELLLHWWNTDYNPPLLRGGASYTYISGTAEFEHSLDLGDYNVTNYRHVDRTIIDERLHVEDYTGRLSEEQLVRIEDLGAEFRNEYIGDLFVVITPEMSSMAQARARTIAENIGLDNESSRRGVLLMVGLDNNKVRLLLGAEHETRLLKEQIPNLLNQYFGLINDYSDLEESIMNTLEKVLDELKIPEGGLERVPESSRLSYLSDGMNYPPQITDIKEGERYYVAFASDSEVPGFFSRIFDSDHELFSPNAAGKNALLIAPANELFEECDILE